MYSVRKDAQCCIVFIHVEASCMADLMFVLLYELSLLFTDLMLALLYELHSYVCPPACEMFRLPRETRWCC